MLMLASLQVGEASQEMAGALVATGVFVQILLVVVLGVPPLAGRQDLRHDLALPPLLVDLGRDLLGDLGLLVVVREDARAVLRSVVRPLAVRGGGVVHAVEELEELLVGDLGRVVDDLCRFGVCARRPVSTAKVATDPEGGSGMFSLTASLSSAHSSVGRVVDVAPDVAHARVVQALPTKVLAVQVLHAPEASCGQGRLLCALRYRGQARAVRVLGNAQTA